MSPAGESSGSPDWADVVESSPIPAMLLGGDGAGDDRGRVMFANAAARELLGGDARRPFGRPPFLHFVDRAAHDHVTAALDAATLDGPVGDSSTDPTSGLSEPCGITAPILVARGPGDATGGHPRAMVLQVRPTTNGSIIVQLTRRDGWQAVDRVVVEQHRFRSALMELSELAHTTEDDNEFYQRLIERAVEVVPGAQGGSVQLKIPDTASFRFVAAVGYDLVALQRHVLEQKQFFRDAWNPLARIVRDFSSRERSPEVTEWLETAGRLSEIVVNVSAPVLSDGFPVAFLSLDNFEDPDALTEASVEMTTVLSRLIGDLWRRRELEAELRAEREAFRHLALHDPLTGLANRRNLERSLTDALSVSERRGRPAAVLFVDVDEFKRVNDQLGHEVGDRLLVEVSAGLGDAVRQGDLVGRWGGDEFLVLPHRIEDSTEVMNLADRILTHFERELDLGVGRAHRARLSIGIGWSPDSDTDTDRLVRAADEALYEAKAAGKSTSRLRKA